MSTGPISTATLTSAAQASDLETLYSQAFDLYGSEALWNLRPVVSPTPADLVAITRALRTHGGMGGRRLAEEIEILCRAAD